MGHGLMRASALMLCGCVCAVVVVPTSAKALEFNSGVSVGGIQIGTAPQFAVSPFAGWFWRQEKDFRFEVHHMFSIIPGARVGVYDRTAVALGYDWKTGTVSLGPSFSIYSTPVCSAVICNRVMGAAPGGHTQVEWYYAEPFGVAVSANLDWAGGDSRVLHDDWTAMVAIGPVWRFRGKSK